MTRTVDAATVTASKAKVVRSATLILLRYASADARYASTPFDIGYDWNSDTIVETFQGVGALGSISSTEEGTAVAPQSITATLTGIDLASIAVALGDSYQGRDCRIWEAFLDKDHAIIGAPYLQFRGRMDTQDIELGETATVTLTVRSRLADWRRQRIRRYTNEDQQNQYPGDLGLEFVSQMAERQLIWGRG